jgi:hypothetical protein
MALAVFIFVRLQALESPACGKAVIQAGTPAVGNTISLTPAQQEKLAVLVRSDSDAARLFQKLRKLADASLNSPAHPVVRIDTAGKLASDPAKVKSRVGLEDMRELYALGFAAAVTSNPAYGAAAKRKILSWARTNQPSGVPIDESKLEPLFVAYELTRPGYSDEDRRVVETWLRTLARREMEGARASSVTARNNWNSHRLKIVGLIGFLLEDRSLIDYAVGGFKKQIEVNLRPDGSSLDFHERDALHYHCYDLEPLLTLALIAHQNGVELYDYAAPNGASLRKAVNFLVPYCEGSAVHSEWVHSKVEFDRERAEAGESKFQIGSRFNPRDGLRALELASFFDQGLKPLVGKLAKRAGTKYPTWPMVLNEASRQ